MARSVDDPVGVLMAFAEALREAGVAAGMDRIQVAAEALGHWSGDPYWPLRVSFCGGEADLLGFDSVYRSWFHRDPPGDADQVPPPTETPAEAPGSGDQSGSEAGSGAGDTAQLATRDFDEMTEHELHQVAAWVQLLRPVPLRRTLRRRPARSGGIDAARTLRLMLRHGGEPLRILRRRQATRPRRLLLLVDVSASMRPYDNVLLHFAHAALRANPRTAEAFAIGTRYTQLTAALSARRTEIALSDAGRVRADWSGGTTLGVALRDFLRHWGASTAVRSAIVVLGSDGFEFRDPALMIAQVARLARMARVLLWVDPACRIDGYRPVDGHIAQAQAHATAVLGCHSYQALRDLAKVITNA